MSTVLFLKSQNESVKNGQNIMFNVLNVNELELLGATVTTAYNYGVHTVKLYWVNKPSLVERITNELKGNLTTKFTYFSAQGERQTPLYRFQINDGQWFVGDACTTSISNHAHRLFYGVTEHNDSQDYCNQNTYVRYRVFSSNYGGNNYDNCWCPIVCSLDNELYIGFPSLNATYNSDNVLTAVNGFGSFAVCYKCSDLGDFHFTDEPEPTFPDPSDGGGYNPTPDPESETIPVPPKPSVNVSDIGYLNVYAVTETGLRGFVEEIFPEIAPPVIPENPSIQDTLTAVTNSIINFSTNYANQNLLNYVIDVHAIPVTQTGGDVEGIRVGYKALTTTGKKITSDYVDFDCGTITVPERYANYLDYTGTKCDLFLPFIGSVNIKPEYILNGSLQVVYRFNILDGSCVAFVLSTSSKSNLSESVIGTYHGSCVIHLPIYGRDFATMCATLLSSGTNILGTASKNPLVQFSNYGDTIGEALTVSASKIPVIGSALTPDTPVSNGFSATSSFCGIRYPYLVISRLKPSWSANYTKEKGLPYNVKTKLSTITGFVMTDNSVHVDNILCTDDERNLIHSALTNGIIL